MFDTKPHTLSAAAARPGTRSRSGLTLLETIIALSVLVIGMFALFDAQVTAQRTHERTANMGRAYQEIQAQIETVQYLPFATVRDSFKGASFSVAGLTPPFTSATERRSMCGTITKVANPDPYDPTLGPGNPNRFAPKDEQLPLRFRVEWVDNAGMAEVEVVYVLAFRGL
jgi:hypothetical protein